MSNSMGKLKWLYQRNSLLHLPLYDATRSKAYHSTLSLLEESEHWTKEQLDAWSLGKIRDIVDYAIHYVPYYREAYKSVGLSSGQEIKTFLDFEKLPTVSKPIIKENYNLFCSEEKDIPYKEYCTSGTQMPFSFNLDKDYVGREQAFFDYYWKKCGGYRHSKDRCIIIRGGGKTQKHFEYNQIYNYKLFDSDYVSDTSLLAYYDLEIRKFDASFMQAYPSSIYGLAKNYLNAGMKAPSFEVIFLGSENVLPSQLKVIEECFNPKKVFYHYGHSEETLLGIKYSGHKGYGFMPQYGHCEVIDSGGKSVGASGFGELTGTTWSKKMPFIRYRTNDFATLGNDSINEFPYNSIHIESIEGRRQEFVIRSDGRQVSIVSICSEHMPAMSKIKEMQFEQFTPGELIINCVFYEDSDVGSISNAIITAMERKFEGMVKCQIKSARHVKKRIMEKQLCFYRILKTNRCKPNSSFLAKYQA